MEPLTLGAFAHGHQLARSKAPLPLQPVQPRPHLSTGEGPRFALCDGQAHRPL